MKSIKINNQLFYEAALVKAVLGVDEDYADDELTEVEGKIHIPDNTPDLDGIIKIYICQNSKQGEYTPNNIHKDLYGYYFSWVVKIDVNTNEITSNDTQSIKLIKNYFDSDILVNYDDDVMPEDWVCLEEITKDL